MHNSTASHRLHSSKGQKGLFHKHNVFKSEVELIMHYSLSLLFSDMWILSRNHTYVWFSPPSQFKCLLCSIFISLAWEFKWLVQPKLPKNKTQFFCFSPFTSCSILPCKSFWFYLSRIWNVCLQASTVKVSGGSCVVKQQHVFPPTLQLLWITHRTYCQPFLLGLFLR